MLEEAPDFSLSEEMRNAMGRDAVYKRFICISKNLEIYPDASTISIMLSHVRRPASL